MKKIVYLILLGVMFLIPNIVKAQAIHMSTPNEMWGYFPNENHFVQYTPNYYDGFYLANSYLCIQNGDCIRQVGAKWNNISWCDGKSTTVSGQMALYGGVNTLNSAIVYGNAGNNGGACQTQKASDYVVNFTCTFDSVVNTTFQIYLTSYDMGNADAYSKFNYGVSPNMNVTCNIGNSDVINNQNQNSQKIINNQNENKREIIENQNQNQQQTNEKLDETNKQLGETNDYLKDDTAPESDISSLGNVQGLLPAGPVDSLLNIPFYFLSIVTSSFGGVCTPLTGNFVFDTELSIPCFSEIIYNDIPSSIMVFINLIPTTFLLIVYFKHLYKKVSRAVSLETTGDDEWGVL